MRRKQLENHERISTRKRIDPPFVGNLIHPNIYGFSKNIPELLLNLWKKKILGYYIVTFDLRHAFSSVDIYRLRKLVRKKIPAHLLKKLEDCGAIGHYCMTTPQFTWPGLPQGFSTSPLLFAIYLSPVISRMKATYGIDMFFYADNGFAITSSLDQAKKVRKYLNQAFSKHSFKNRKLKLSEKTKKRLKIYHPKRPLPALGVILTSFGLIPSKSTYFYKQIVTQVDQLFTIDDNNNFPSIRQALDLILPPTSWVRGEGAKMFEKAQKRNPNPRWDDPWELEADHLGLPSWESYLMDFFGVPTNLVQKWLEYKPLSPAAMAATRRTRFYQNLVIQLVNECQDPDLSSIFPAWMLDYGESWPIATSFNSEQLKVRFSILDCAIKQADFNELYNRYILANRLLKEKNNLSIQRAVHIFESVLQRLHAIFIYFSVDTVTGLFETRPLIPPLSDIEKDFQERLVFNELNIINRWLPNCPFLDLTRLFFPLPIIQRILRANLYRTKLEFMLGKKITSHPWAMEHIGRTEWCFHGVKLRKLGEILLENETVSLKGDILKKEFENEVELS